MVGTPTKRENNFAKKKPDVFTLGPSSGWTGGLTILCRLLVLFFPLILNDNFLMVNLNNCVLQILLSFKQNGTHGCDPGTRKIVSPEMTGWPSIFFLAVPIHHICRHSGRGSVDHIALCAAFRLVGTELRHVCHTLCSFQQGNWKHILWLMRPPSVHRHFKLCDMPIGVEIRQ